jgi:hypothetical protein
MANTVDSTIFLLPKKQTSKIKEFHSFHFSPSHSLEDIILLHIFLVPHS